jgi:hypothetical protein
VVGWLRRWETILVALIAALVAISLNDHRSVATASPPATDAARPVAAVETVPAPTASDTSNEVVAENAKPGSSGWQLAKAPWHVEAYADTTSAKVGDVVTLYVDTDAPTWTVEAYRMGWYQGLGGRLIWQSGPQPGARQAPPFVDPTTHMAEARWQPSLQLTVGPDWVPGSYLLVLRTSLGGGHYVPLTVRDDSSHAALVIVDAVTTWEAYNTWGGCSLYMCPTLKGVRRATVVSFDRPYTHAYNLGAADFIDHELALISLAEHLGLDVTYVTDVDIDRDPTLVMAHKAVISLGHDEYYSSSMRQALIDARDAGINLAFFGANAMYRHIRLTPSWDGRAQRREVNYRSMKDPMAATNPSEATVEWRSPPDPRPEAAIIGAQYACEPVAASMRLLETSSWVFAGSHATDGEVLPNVVANEYDRVVRSSPKNTEVLAHSPVTCAGRSDYSDMTYYSAPSGAGVFDTGSIHWICTLNGMCPSNAAAEQISQAVTTNVLTAFAAGPAGTAHPSHANLSSARRPARQAPAVTEVGDNGQ